MAGITLVQAEAQLTTWLAADTAVAAGQSFDMNGRALTRVNAKEIRENIDYWDNKVREITNGGRDSGMRIYGATPT